MPNAKQHESEKVTLFGEDVTTVKHEKDSGDIVWGILIIGAGIVLLANNLGLVSWDFWQEIIIFWPAIFIIFGVQVILGNTFLSRLLIGVLTLVFLAVITLIGLRAVNAPFIPTLSPSLEQIIRFLETRL